MYYTIYYTIYVLYYILYYIYYTMLYIKLKMRKIKPKKREFFLSVNSLISKHEKKFVSTYNHRSTQITA